MSHYEWKETNLENWGTFPRSQQLESDRGRIQSLFSMTTETSLEYFVDKNCFKNEYSFL